MEWFSKRKYMSSPQNKLDVEKIQYLSLELKRIILNEPEREARITIDRFIRFIRNKENWIQRTPE